MKLFWKIFLCFWLATILMLAFGLGMREMIPVKFLRETDTDSVFESDAAKAALTAGATAYEAAGPDAAASAVRSALIMAHRRFFLFSEDGVLLAGNERPPNFFGPLAKTIAHRGGDEMARYFGFGFRMFYICPIQSASGHRYMAILAVFEPGERVLRLRFWFNLTVGMIPAALVCIALSLYITRPISRLRKTAQRLASGDLSARASPLGTRRNDEVGDMARDFDTMAARIEVLMSAQRRFVADVSHELGAPLTRMHLALALLRRQFAEKNSSEIDRIERETDKLSNLVQQLLLLAGLEAGVCPAETLAPVSVRSLCENIIDDESFEAAQANCQITGEREDVVIEAYPQLLRRAIDNVVRNAIRYSPPGSEVRLDCRVDEESRHVIFDVIDSGSGVPESMLSDIFKPFFRTAPGRESKSGGTGLGLAIAHEAVRLHDGTIDAFNRKSGGLHVTISLPLRTASTENDLRSPRLSANTLQ